MYRLFCLFLACITINVPTKNIVLDSFLTDQKSIDFQGHRGCRGLMPENTIPGFLHALDLGVTTLELDVVITKDHRVICSHEPWYSHEIALDPMGNTIAEADEKNHKIYHLDYAETTNYDVGTKYHPRFPDQKKMPAYKPLLEAVIDSAEAHAKKTNRALPYYNIETKITPAGDGVFHPTPEVFSELILEILYDKGIAERSIIQSFDPRTLQYIRKNHPKIKLALLVENQNSIENNIGGLGFIPDIYSPDFTLVNEETIEFCRQKNMKIIPWTVNELSDMQKLVQLGVDGIISDYPDKFKDL